MRTSLLTVACASAFRLMSNESAKERWTARFINAFGREPYDEFELRAFYDAGGRVRSDLMTRVVGGVKI